MEVSRRALLAAPFLPVADRLPATPPQLLPGPDGAVALTWAGRGAVVLPEGSRPLRPLPFDGLDLLGVAVPADSGLSLLALCGMGDGRPALLGLEILRWRSGGAHLDTRPPESDGAHLIALRREAAVPRDSMRWQRAIWTDYLAWAPPRLADAPARTPLAGTWQAALATLRHDTLDWLATPRARLLPPDITRLGLTSAIVARLFSAPTA